MDEKTNYLDKVISYLSISGVAMGAVALVLVILLVTLNVCLRYLFKEPLIFADEYSAYSFLFMSFLAMGYAMRKEAHIRVEIIFKRLSERSLAILEIVISLLGLFFVGLLIWFCSDFAIMLVDTNRRSGTAVNTPLWVPAIFMVLGLCILGLEIVARLARKSVALAKLAKR